MRIYITLLLCFFANIGASQLEKDQDDFWGKISDLEILRMFIYGVDDLEGIVRERRLGTTERIPFIVATKMPDGTYEDPFLLDEPAVMAAKHCGNDYAASVLLEIQRGQAESWDSD